MENLPQNPNQPEQYQMPPLEPTPTGLNQLSHSPKKLLVSTIILAAIIGGYSVLAQSNSWWPFEATIQDVDYTANWETYRNEQRGFEVSYPLTWKFGTTNSQRDLSKGFLQINLSNVTVDENPGCQSNFEGIIIHVGLTKDPKQDLKELISVGINTEITKGLEPSGHLTPVMIADHIGFKVERSGGSCDGPGYWIEQNSTHYARISLNFGVGGQLDIVNKIFSTFKFINGEQSYLDNLVSQVTNWSAYKSTSEGIGGDDDGNTPEQNMAMEKYLSKVSSEKSVKKLNFPTVGVAVYYTPNYLNWSDQYFLAFKLAGAGITVPLTAYTDKLLWVDTCYSGIAPDDDDPERHQKIDRLDKCVKDRDLLLDYFKDQSR